MGGKQKRAAKYKRWMQTHPKVIPEKDSDVECEEKAGGSNDDSSNSEMKPIPLKIRQEVLKYRQKKSKRSGGSSWFSRKIDHIFRAVDKWPTWPFSTALMIVLYIFVFFLIRTLILMLAPKEYTDVDRAALYNGLKNAAPKPIYKMIRIIDHLFTAKELSMQGIYKIIFPPEDYSYGQNYPDQQFHRKLQRSL